MSWGPSRPAVRCHVTELACRYRPPGVFLKRRAVHRNVLPVQSYAWYWVHQCLRGLWAQVDPFGIDRLAVAPNSWPLRTAWFPRGTEHGTPSRSAQRQGSVRAQGTVNALGPALQHTGSLGAEAFEIVSVCSQHASAVPYSFARM